MVVVHLRYFSHETGSSGAHAAPPADFSCATYQLPSQSSAESGLLVARVNVVNLTSGQVRNVSFELKNTLTDESSEVELAPRGLLILAGNDGDRLQITALVFESTRAMYSTNQPWMASLNHENLLVRYRFPVAGGQLPAVAGGAVTNLGVIEASVFASTFSGEVTTMSTGRRIQSASRRVSAVPLTRPNRHARVQNTFRKAFGESAWLEVPWLTW